MHPIIQKIIHLNTFAKKHKTIGHYILKLFNFIEFMAIMGTVFYGFPYFVEDDSSTFNYFLICIALIIASYFIKEKVVKTMNDNTILLQYELYRQLKKELEQKSNKEKILLAINYQEVLRNESLSTIETLTNYDIQGELFFYKHQYNELLLLDTDHLQEKLDKLKKEKNIE